MSPDDGIAALGAELKARCDALTAKNVALEQRVRFLESTIHPQYGAMPVRYALCEHDAIAASCVTCNPTLAEETPS